MEPLVDVHLLLSETKAGANQSVNNPSKTVKTLPLQQWWSVKNEKHPLFPFLRYHFGAQIYMTMRERLPFTDERFMITPHCFRHGGAAQDFMLMRLSKDELKDGGTWKNDITLYTYVQRARSVIVKVTLTPNGRRVLDKIHENLASLFNVPKLTTR